MTLVFFIAAIGEELGWTGYATDPLQERWKALQAGVLLGLVTAVWHLLLFIQVNRSPSWIVWQSLFIVATRIIILWIYNNTGSSVFATILFHTTINLCSFIPPFLGFEYDPRTSALILSFFVVIITIVWGYRTLTRSKI